MKFSNLFFLLFLVLMSSCFYDDDIPIPQIDIINKPPEIDTVVIWKKVLHEDTLDILSIDTYFSNGKIVTSYSIPFSGNTEDSNPTLLATDSDGIEQWRWTDFLSPTAPHQFSKTILYDNILLASSRAFNYAIDVNTGITKWYFFHEEGAPYMSFTESLKFVFKTITYGNSPRTDSTSILVSSLESGQFSEVLKIRKTDDYEVNVPNAASFLNASGDTIMVYQKRQIVISPYDGKIDFYAYNLSKKEMEWTHEDIGNGESNIRPPLIDGDHVYFCGQFHVFCYEKETGELVWERKLHHDFQGSNFLIHENLFITNLDNGDLVAINKNTGQDVWIKEDLSACCVELRIYDGKIYIANGDLYIVEASSGHVLFEYETPTAKEKGRRDAYFSSAVAVDLENQVMYTTDNYYLLKMKLPDF